MSKASRMKPTLYHMTPAGNIVSDFKGVQSFIDHARKRNLKSTLQVIQTADRFYLYLQREDPQEWNESDLERYLETVRPEWRNSVRTLIERLLRHTRALEVPRKA